jgi:hypothetical protein
MNPKPLLSLNHFTVPDAIIITLLQLSGNTLPENLDTIIPIFLNWIGWMQELLENHLERKPNYL